MNRLLRKGFTLVELLIVIALIAAIALIVIAAINPIEQANRARDADYKSTSVQLLGAIERYYITNSQYPWVTIGPFWQNNTGFGPIHGNSRLVGVCGTNCTNDGLLITSQELKVDFKGRDFLKTTTLDKYIAVGRDAGENRTPFACFVPKSVQERQKAVADAKVWDVNPGTGTPRSLTTSCNAAGADWVTLRCHICFPS